MPLPAGQRERITVSVSPDGMTASASVVAGAVAGRDAIDAALAKAGISFGIDEAVLATLTAQLADSTYAGAPIVIATGKAAQAGRDGTFEPAFHVGIQPGHLGSDGKMDFYDRELLKPAAVGQVLGWLRSPVAGIDGVTVGGKHVVAAAVHATALRLESGVVAGPDGAVNAARDGVIVYIDGKSLDVSSQVLHAASVDLASGSLETEGSMTVRGDVMPSFTVRTGGDLVVEGSVDAGSLFAGGNVHVTGGVLGGNTGTVSAQGRIVARHADRATLKARGGVSLESATHCEISADWVEIARIRGGRTAAQRSVVAHEAGAPRGGTSTTLAAAVVLPSLVDIVQAAQAAKEKRSVERQAGHALRDDGARGKGGKLGLHAVALQSEAQERKVALAKARARLLATAFVEVGGTAFAGTIIELGELRLLLERDLTATRFSVDSELNRIRQSPKQ